MKNQLSDQSRAPAAEQIVANLQVLLDLSKQPLSSQVFYQRLLDIVISSLQAESGVIWKIKQSGTEPFVRSGSSESLEDDVFSDERADLLQAFLAQDSPQHLSRTRDSKRSGNVNPGGNSGSEQVNLSTHFLLRDEATTVVLELVNRGSSDWTNSTSFTTIINAVRELTLDFHRNSEIKFLKEQNEVCNSLFEFSKRINSQLEFDPILFETVNGLCQLFPVDRVTFCRKGSNRFNVAVVSGVSTFSKSSTLCKMLEAAVNEAAQDGLPYRYSISDQNQELPIDSDFHSYISSSGCTQLSISPISELGDETAKSKEPLGVLVLESFEPQPAMVSEPLLALVLELVGTSLKNARKFETAKQLGPLNQFRSLSGRRNGWPLKRLGIFAGIVAACIVLMFLITVDFEIRAEGRVLPRHQQRIFSPADGEVVELFVRPDDPIELEAPLLRIHDADLDLRLAKIQGERLATIEKLQAIESRRITGSDAGQTRRAGDDALLSATAEELQVLLSSQQEQIEILQKQLVKLTVLSPMDGEVTTWQFDKLLSDRPVKRGQLLMTVADKDGEWDGELEIRDHRVGHVLKAIDQNQTLPVSIVLVANPDQIHDGELVGIAGTTDESLTGEPIVRCVANMTWSDVRPPRPGAKIVAKIHCGRRSLAFVWFHEPISAIRAALF